MQYNIVVGLHKRIRAIFGTESWAITPAISTKNKGFILNLECCQHAFLLCLPKHIYNWDQKLLSGEKKNVGKLIAAQLKNWNKRRLLVGKAPQNNIAADIKMLPAGMPLQCGWSFQLYLASQWEQCTHTCRKLPVVARLVVNEVFKRPQLVHVANNVSRHDSNTKYFFSS